MEMKEEEKKAMETKRKEAETEMQKLEKGEEVKVLEEKEEAMEAEIRALEAELSALWEKTARSGSGGLRSAMIQKLGDARGALRSVLVRSGLLKEEETREEVIRERMEVVKKNLASLEKDVTRMKCLLLIIKYNSEGFARFQVFDKAVFRRRRMPPIPYHIGVDTDVKNREVSSALHQITSNGLSMVTPIVIAVKPYPQSVIVSVINCSYKLKRSAAVVSHYHCIYLQVICQC